MIVAGAALARRLEWAEGANDFECAPAAGGNAVERMAGGWAVFAGAGSPLSRAIGMGLSGPVGESEVDALERFFHCRATKVNVDLCPLADPGLLEILGRRGYRAAEFNNVLVRDLKDVEPYPADSRVRRALGSEQDLWSSTVGCSFFETGELSHAEMEIGRAVFRIGQSECFLLFTDEGEAAAGAALALREGLALLFADGTIPRFRNHGCHTALIRSRVNTAIAWGCDLATASAAPGSVSQRNFERLGFQVAYTKVMLTEG